MPRTRRPATTIPPWSGSFAVGTSWHTGRERTVTIYRAVQEGSLRQRARAQVATVARLAVAGAAWAGVTYVAALAVNRRLDLVASESLRDGEFQILLMAVGMGVWVVAGVPIVFGLMALRAIGERMFAHTVSGTVVFRGAYDPRRSVDDNRRMEYHVAIDDGVSDRVPSYAGSYGAVSRVAEGDVVRASVSPRGRLLHIVVTTRAVTPP